MSTNPIIRDLGYLVGTLNDDDGLIVDDLGLPSVSLQVASREQFDDLRERLNLSDRVTRRRLYDSAPYMYVCRGYVGSVRVNLECPAPNPTKCKCCGQEVA